MLRALINVYQDFGRTSRNVRYWLLADIPAYVVLCLLSGVKRTFSWGGAGNLGINIGDSLLRLPLAGDGVNRC